MPGYRRVGARFLALSVLALALVGVIPLVPAAPARAASRATSQATSQAASRVVNPAPVEQSTVTLGDTSVKSVLFLRRWHSESERGNATSQLHEAG